jgi:hypothetical protein
MTDGYGLTPSGVPVDAAPTTGQADVDAALADLARVADAPPGEQVAPLTAADDALRDTLDSIGDV